MVRSAVGQRASLSIAISVFFVVFSDVYCDSLIPLYWLPNAMSVTRGRGNKYYYPQYT
jgi:hypothetical protein